MDCRFTAAATESAAWRMVPPRVPPVSRRYRWYLEVHCMPRDAILLWYYYPTTFWPLSGVLATFEDNKI